MRSSSVLTMTAAVALAVAGLSTPALAGIKKTDLPSGYTCERVGVNFIECTKPGSPTYWCDDAGNCEAKPKKTIPKDIVGPKGGVLEVDPGSSGGKKGPTGMDAVPPKARN